MVYSDNTVDTITKRQRSRQLHRYLVAILAIFILIFGAGGCSDDDSPGASGDELAYSGTFGATYLGSGQGTKFAIYAPDAESVSVAGSFNSFDNSADPMTKNSIGVWELTVSSASPSNAYKFYSASFTDNWVRDPYGKSFDGNDNDNTLIIDNNYSWNDSGWTRPAKESLVIYELHVEDFTRNDNDATSGANYLGMIDKIPYLTNLGVNCVEIMPIAEWGGNGYSWGYNSACYFAPENSLSPDVSDGSAYENFKKLVDALHQAGIAVVLDVVYNHTFEDSPLWKIDSDAYYSTDPIDWGQKLDLTSAATYRYVKDNLVFWMDEFHIDGFRFDSTENMDHSRLMTLIDELITAGYNSYYYIFEEWDGENNSSIQSYNTSNAASVISSWGSGYKDVIWTVLDGSTSDQLGRITYFSKDNGWNYPGSPINFFSSHDEGTLTGRGYGKGAIRTAAVHLLTAMGIPMLWMGEEVLRDHHGNEAENPTDEANNIMDWNTLRSANGDMLQFFSALIKLRIAHPALRQTSTDPANDGTFSWNSDWDKRSVGYTCQGISGDNDFVVLINYDQNTAKTFTNVSFSQTGDWYLMCDGSQATNKAPGLDTWNITSTSSNITVEPTNALILMSDAVNP